MAITLYDFLSFPFNGGRGIRADQIDGLGIQSYLASNVAWDDAADPAEIRLSGFYGAVGGANIVGSNANILFRVPAVTPRVATELTGRVGTDSGLIVRDLQGRRISARDLTPSALYAAFYAAGSPGSLRFVEPLPVRPQDFNILVARVYQPYTADNVAAQLASGTPYATNDVQSPADTMPGTTNSLGFGVPDFAPDIDRVFPLVPLGVTGYSANGPNYAYTMPIGGITYKWWFGPAWLADRVFRVTFLGYS